MKSRRSILARGAFFVVGAVVSVAVLAGCGGGVPGDSIADMAGNPITTKAFNHWMYVAAKGQAAQSPGSPVIIPDPPDFKNCIASLKTLAPARLVHGDAQEPIASRASPARDQVMDFLVRAYWYQAQAATQHIKVTDKQVQTAFQTAKAAQFPTDSAVPGVPEQTGQTLQDILYRVRVNQIYKELLAKSGSSVTPAAIQAYYKSHLSQFGTPETRNIRIVLTKTKAQAQQALAALRGGASWQATAKKYSTDHEHEEQGRPADQGDEGPGGRRRSTRPRSPLRRRS